MVAGERFEGCGLHFRGSWGHFGGLGAVLEGLGARIEGSVALLDANMAEKRNKSAKKIALAGSRYHLGSGKIGPRGGPRWAKGEPNGGKMGVKIASRMEIDFQAMLDAKMVRKF